MGYFMNSSSEISKLLKLIDDLPSHDPDRFETLDGLDNPACTNMMRAAYALEGLDAFQKACGMNEDVHVAAADLIDDLLHLVHSMGFNPKTVLEHAIGHFVAEAG